MASLRCSDVFTRYSISQYLILLPTVTIEKGEMVLKRIISNFRKLYNRKDITVEIRLQPVLPWKNTPLGETFKKQMEPGRFHLFLFYVLGNSVGTP